MKLQFCRSRQDRDSARLRWVLCRIWISILFILHLLAPTSVRADVEIIGISTTSGDAASMSWTHVVPAASNKGLLVSISTAQDARVTNVSFAGQILTRIASSIGPGGEGAVEIWGLANPPEGTAAVSVSLTRARQFVAGAATLSGVSLSSPVASFGTAAGSTTSATHSMPVSEPVVLFAALSTIGGAGIATPLSGQTSRWNLARGGGGSDAYGAALSVQTSTTTTVGWTLSSAKAWSLAVVAIRPAPPTVQVSGISKVISDPINGGTNPKLIPGALVRYCLIASNPSGAPTAQSVTLTNAISTLPITFVPGTIRINGGLTNGECDFTSGSVGGSYTNGSITATLADLSSGQARTVYFDAFIN